MQGPRNRLHILAALLAHMGNLQSRGGHRAKPGREARSSKRRRCYGERRRRGTFGAQPQSRWSKNESKTVRRQLVVSCGGAATVFDLIEEPINQITRSIRIRAEADRPRP
jgi:hypothetical protein